MRRFISLAPKVAQPETIALCNFTYKIVAKLLVNQLKPIMGDTISNE